MMGVKSVEADPVSIALQREAQLAAAQVAQGVTTLGKANHAKPGLYAQAFFGLSIGFERIGKLIFISDYAIKNGGNFPTDKELREIGHKITLLMNKCDDIGKTIAGSHSYEVRPSDPIHDAIVETMSLFATKLRYYNLNSMAGEAGDQVDPISLWWTSVAEPICKRHYTARMKKRDELGGRIVEVMLGDHAAIMHTSEEGKSISELRSFLERGAATRVVQKYGRFYTLQLIRWLASLLRQLSDEGAYTHRIRPLLGLHETFAMFLNDDSWLLRRKTWSAYW